MPGSRLPLKNGVDLQLQQACNDSNWPVVVRLCDKRLRALKDQYYETLKIVAESQVDDPTSKFTALTALWQYVQDGTVLKDVDALDLLDWACQDLLAEEDYAETLGVLRARAVKANPKARNDAIRCLETCLLHWDLNSAQQIAASLDRSFPQERMFMFWNIVVTHMLSVSAQSPPEKKKLYGMLAQKQIERAAQAASQTDEKPAVSNSRTVQTEEEILLLYAIVQHHGSREDLDRLICSPVFGPVPQFLKGRKELFSRILKKYKSESDWASAFKLCHECLTSPSDGSSEPNFLASDWVVWKSLIEAAAQLQSSDSSVSKTVQDLLLTFANSNKLRPIYRRNILLARLSSVFTLSPAEGLDAVDGKPSSPRFVELLSYIKDQFLNPACFEDVKLFAGKLDSTGLEWLATKLWEVCETKDDRDAATLEVLSLKVRYLVSTFQENAASQYGGAEIDKAGFHCLKPIIDASLEAFHRLKPTFSHAASELAVLTALCYIDLAWAAAAGSQMASTSESVKYLLSATMVLEMQLPDDPKNSVMLLVLVQLHLRIGSTMRARGLWEDLGVKRTIMDSLAPVLYDRLSSIAPKLLSKGDRFGYELSMLLGSHYDTSLKLRMHRRLGDSFDSESYSSILQIPEYMEKLRFGCTRVLSLVEESRTARLIDASTDSVLNDPRCTEISDRDELNEVIDYGSFPSWGSSEHPPAYQKLRIGPPPSNVRAHLSLAAESFHDLLSYTPPAIYKVTTPPNPAFVLESMARLSNTLSRFARTMDQHVTAEEAIYYNLLCLLSTLVTLSATVDKATAEEALGDIVSAAKSGLSSLQNCLPQTQDNDKTRFTQMSNMHSVSTFRDASVAVRLTCQWILAHNERAKAQDKSGQTGLPKGVVAPIKELQGTAEASLKLGKKVLGEIKLLMLDWTDIRKNIPDASKILKGIDGDRAKSELTVSWLKTLKGWDDVKWE